MAEDDAGKLTREDFDAGPTSCDEIERGLYLGNLTAATNVDWLKETRITNILTLDSCPLPRKIRLLPDITFKYIQVTDLPREDLLTYFEETYQFVKHAQEDGRNTLVHCYFGVSRSAAVVIAFIMKKYSLNFEEAFEVTKSKRRFVAPNPGFVAQLKLYQDMGYSIDNTNVQFRMYRLQIAADKVRKAKILPQTCIDLVKPDPALETIRPEPTVYRCKRCRRIVASASNILPHAPKEKQVWRHVSSKRYEKGPKLPNNKNVKKFAEGDENNEPTGSELCTKTYFIEPLAWMPDITHNLEGKLNCPKCASKLGSFSWIAGCQCPCGSKIAPAFYLIPSKVDWSNVVQNVQVTV